MSFRRRDEDFPVSGTLWQLPGGGFMPPSEVGTFSNTFCILTGKAEVLVAILFSSVTWDCGVFLYFPSRALAGSLTLCGSLGKPGGPRGPRVQARV